MLFLNLRAPYEEEEILDTTKHEEKMRGVGTMKKGLSASQYKRIQLPQEIEIKTHRRVELPHECTRKKEANLCVNTTMNENIA